MPAPTLTARELLRLEYGRARNMMTPDVVRVGKLGRHAAYELATGTGLLPGSTLYGVSVVRQLEDGTTERVYGASRAFHGLAEAEAWIESLRDPAGLERAARADA